MKTVGLCENGWPMEEDLPQVHIQHSHQYHEALKILQTLPDEEL